MNVALERKDSVKTRDAVRKLQLRELRAIMSGIIIQWMALVLNFAQNAGLTGTVQNKTKAGEEKREDFFPLFLCLIQT